MCVVIISQATITGMNPTLIGGAVLIIFLVIAYMSMSSSSTGNKNDTAAEVRDPIAEVKEPAAKMVKEQEVLADAQEGQEEKDENVEAKNVTKAVPPKDEPATKPSEISGLVGWFEPKNFSYKKGQWKDSSGKNNHATEIKGRPEKVTEDGVTFVMGGNAAAGIRFPSKCMTRGRKFTMFSVARYNGSRQGRIIDGYGGNANFLSGFHSRGTHADGSMGGSHRAGSGWISHPHYRRELTDEQEKLWVLNVEQKHLHRMDGHQRSGKTNGRARIPLQMSINHGDYTPHPTQRGYWAKQQSDWAVGDIIFYNRELSLSEVKKVEIYLMRKFKIQREVRPRFSNRNTYAQERGWLDPFPDCQGSACAEQFKSLGSNRMGSDCGPEGAMSRSYFHRHHRTHPRGSNGNYWFGNACMHGLEGGANEEKKTKYIDITNSKQWYEKPKRELWEMDCKGKGIAGFEYESSADKSRLRLKYKCHQAPLNEESCREISASRWGKDKWQSKNTWNNDRNRAGGPFSAMEGQDLDCGDGQVLTKVEYADLPNGEVKMKAQCCNVADTEGKVQTWEGKSWGVKDTETKDTGIASAAKAAAAKAAAAKKSKSCTKNYGKPGRAPSSECIINKSTKWIKHVDYDCSEPGMGWGKGDKPCHKRYAKSVNNLEKHHIDCGNNGIRGFRLQGGYDSKYWGGHRKYSGLFQYQYECHKGANSKPSGNQRTNNFQWYGNAHVLSLHDHNVDCGKLPIARFRHGRDGHGTRYNYSCGTVPVKGACRDLHTGYYSNREGMKSLRSHHVQCAEDEVMTQFKLDARNGGRQALKLKGWAHHEQRGRYNTDHQYKFRCCKLE